MLLSEEPKEQKQIKENSFQVWYKNFSSQPHNGFFSSGIIFLTLFIIVLLLNYSNIITLKVSLITFHVYPLVFVIFMQFFLGFLFVVFPRFLMQAEIPQKVYMKQFFIYFFGSVLFFISLFVNEALSILASFIIFLAQVMSFRILYLIYKKSVMENKYDTKWVLIAYAAGLFSNLLYIISYIKFPNHEFFSELAINSGFYLFLFLLILSIAQRMIPFFTSIKSPSYVINKSKNFMEIVFAFLALKVIILSFNNPSLNLLCDIPLFIIFTKELIKWKLPFFKLSAIMWVLYLSLYWIPMGFLISSIESLLYIFLDQEIVLEKAVIHIFALGFFTTILVGFGTRVVLGHSGRTPTSDSITTFMFVFLQVIVFARIFAAYSLNFDLSYILFINISASLFIIAFLAWSIKYLPILLKGK